eukprot:303678-Rhodomonas_salina.1
MSDGSEGGEHGGLHTVSRKSFRNFVKPIPSGPLHAASSARAAGRMKLSGVGRHRYLSNRDSSLMLCFPIALLSIVVTGGLAIDGV